MCVVAAVQTFGNRINFKVIAFITDFSGVDRIIDHLKLQFVAAEENVDYL
ncbi:MAG TPA: hypothetical protein VGB72_07345 [Acidobacteriota bacterium]